MAATYDLTWQRQKWIQLGQFYRCLDTVWCGSTIIYVEHKKNCKTFPYMFDMHYGGQYAHFQGMLVFN